MKKATTLKSAPAPFTAALGSKTVAGEVRKPPSAASLLLSTATILVASIATSTVAMVIIATTGEVSRQMHTAAIDTFLDLVATIFFTMLYTIAAGAGSVQRGFMFGLYAGVTLSVLYLLYSWLAVRKGWQIATA